MSNYFQYAAINWPSEGRITLRQPIDDYDLLRVVKVISYTAGYVHGIVAEEDTSERRVKEEMNSACQSLKEVPVKEAKAQIKAYFELHHGENLDYGDIRAALCIPLPTIVEACDELDREGKIAGVEQKSHS